MEYRKDIQILRGLAVLQVALFHLGIPGFASGFLGVDVFFVVSGYLMAMIYDPSNIREFFLKRARRLLPAYFVVVIMVLLTTMMITIPSDYSQVSSQGLFAIPFASNIGFWLENSYFDKSTFKPLLHLWSLGVEIQFYLTIPFLCGIFRRFRGSYLMLLVTSGTLCFTVVGISPKTAFFWLPFRLWEFLIGYGVASWIYKPPAENKAWLAWIGATSLGVIACIPSIHVDGLVAEFVHGHPGLSALLICLATATTLSFGLPPKITELPIAYVFEKIGDYSYSIYLAHFPIIVLFLYQPFGGTVLKPTNTDQTVTLVVLTLIVSTLLFRLVERPLRIAKKLQGWTLPLPGIIIGVALIGPVLQSSLIPETEMLINNAWTDRNEYRCGQIKRILDPRAITCELSEQTPFPAHRILLVGNSHADAIKTAFSEVAQDRNVAVHFMVENNPLMKHGTSPERLVREALKLDASAIVLHYAPDSIDVQVIEMLVALAGKHKIQLSFILPVPTWNKSIPATLWRNLKGLEALPSQTLSDYQSRYGDMIDGLAKIGSDKLKVYQVADIFCRPMCQLMSESGKPLYFDSHHLTLTGSNMLKGVFGRVISDLS